MKMNFHDGSTLLFCGLAFVFFCGVVFTRVEAATKKLESFQEKTKAFQSQLTVPLYETTGEAIFATIDRIIADAEKAGDAIAKQDPAKATFESAMQALDDIQFTLDAEVSRISLIKETSPDEKLRDAATQAIKKFQDWVVGFQYREDIYQAVNAFAKTKPELTGERKKFFDETMRDYQRLGFDLSREQRKELEDLKKELANLALDFRTNINKATHALKFSAAEMEGVPESFLDQEGVKTGDDEYTVMANVTWHFTTVMENARKDSTRKQLFEARFKLASEENIPILKKVLALRDTIAKKLGYKTWADYQTEVRMAKNGDTVEKFLNDLCQKLQPKFDRELAAFAELKAKETGETNPTIHFWDWRYYRNQLMKENYAVDTEALKVYFPYEKTLEGMFRVYETIFGLKIEEVENPQPIHDDVTLHVVSDAKTGEPLGLVYLDMFPRSGKFNHFAQFGIIAGKRLPNGIYQRPTVSLVCNFPPASGNRPALLTYDQTVTLFHEFGHCLHSILTRANFVSFSGTSVPRDFVEVPSQTLEYWLESKQVLDSFAADYRDSSKKFPADVLDRIIEADRATIGTFYRRQLAFGILDITFHHDYDPGADVVKVSNMILSEVFLPVPDDTTFVSYFGHLMGYDAGYYGYAWADVIAADMATIFENAPGGYLDREAGMKLRKEIYEVGDSRDVNESIHAFLGRDRSFAPFLKRIGVE